MTWSPVKLSAVPSPPARPAVSSFPTRTLGLAPRPATPDEVVRWASRLRAKYLDGSVSRGKRHRVGPGLAGPRFVREHPAVLIGREGVKYRARVFARCEALRMWIAWLQFHAIRRGGPMLRARRETLQPDLAAVARWVDALETTYLDRALLGAERDR